MNKKPAFTMVELIFVIVILGILAAVAVPRLNASRDDAEITKFAANLATIYKDVQTYYLANGTAFTNETKIDGSANTANISKITNVPLELSKLYSNSYYYNLKIGGKDCLNIVLRNNALFGESVMIGSDIQLNNVNPLCVKMYEVFASKPELKALLEGLTKETEIIKKNATEVTNVMLFRPLKADGVEFD